MFQIVWKVPDTEIEVPTLCANTDELMIYIRAQVFGKIKILSVNDMPIVDVKTIEVVEEDAHENHAD